MEKKTDLHLIKVINKVKNIGTQTNVDLRMAEREDL